MRTRARRTRGSETDGIAPGISIRKQDPKLNSNIDSKSLSFSEVLVKEREGEEEGKEEERTERVNKGEKRVRRVSKRETKR